MDTPKELLEDSGLPLLPQLREQHTGLAGWLQT